MTISVFRNYVSTDAASTLQETQTLADGQTTVTFGVITTGQTAFYLCGSNVDEGRLCPDDFTIVDTSTIELAQSYPAGSSIYAVGSDLTAEAAKNNVRFYGTVALMQADTLLDVGDTVVTQGYYTAGDGGGAEYLIAAAQPVDGFGDHALNNGNVALLQGDLNQFKFGVTGDGYPIDDGAALNAYANYCRANQVPMRFVQRDGPVLLYTTQTIDLRNLQVYGTGIASINMNPVGDGIGFEAITGIPTRPAFATLYTSAQRLPVNGTLFYSDTASPVIRISDNSRPNRALYHDFGVQGYGGTAGQNAASDELRVTYLNASYDLRNVGFFSAGSDGLVLPNGVELVDWYGIQAVWNNGYGITTDGGGGDDNQEYFTLRKCSLTNNRLDGLLIPRFKKGGELHFCAGNSNGWYGYGAANSLVKPGDENFVRGMLGIEDCVLGAAKLTIRDCYAEDCARLVRIVVSQPIQNIYFEGNRSIPSLNLTDTENHMLWLGRSGSGQFEDLNVFGNSIQDNARGRVLGGLATTGDFIRSSKIGNFQSVTFSTTQAQNDFTTQINATESHIFTGTEEIGDGTGGTFTSNFIIDNTRDTIPGNDTHSKATCYIISANWQATNATGNGAYLLYAFVLPNGEHRGNVIAFGSVTGFTNPPTVATDGTLSVELDPFYRANISRIDMAGFRP